LSKKGDKKRMAHPMLRIGCAEGAPPCIGIEAPSAQALSFSISLNLR